MAAIVVAESFEDGTLGDYLRATNCPGLTRVQSLGDGIFVANPHSGSQSAQLSDGVGGPGLVDSSMTLDAPSGATEVGLFFKVKPFTLDPDAGLYMLLAAGWHHPLTLSGEYLQVFVLGTGDLTIRDTLGGGDTTVSINFDVWHKINARSTGEWSVSTSSGVIATATFDPAPDADRVLFADAGVPGLAGSGQWLVVDDFYYRPGEPPLPDILPAVRQYPRDDALGLGSAPRIHPPPRQGRVVGGYQ